MDKHDPILDHRARIERARLDAEERRAQALIDQRSPNNSPEMRVRTWEKLHQLRLPRDPAHAILGIVAQQTGMPLTEVLAVQRQRAELGSI
jgi:uncharacterized protein YmfQ (DUF2313 family)